MYITCTIICLATFGGWEWERGIMPVYSVLITTTYQSLIVRFVCYLWNLKYVCLFIHEAQLDTSFPLKGLFQVKKKCLFNQFFKSLNVTFFWQVALMWNGPPWSLSYGSWIYIYLSPLTFWVWILLRQGEINTLCDKVCPGLGVGRWFNSCLQKRR